VSCLAKRWHQGKEESAEHVGVKEAVLHMTLNDKCLSRSLDTPAEAGHERELVVNLARNDSATQLT
jgi:hypothetical protein